MFPILVRFRCKTTIAIYNAAIMEIILKLAVMGFIVNLIMLKPKSELQNQNVKKLAQSPFFVYNC